MSVKFEVLVLRLLIEIIVNTCKNGNNYDSVTAARLYIREINK